MFTRRACGLAVRSVLLLLLALPARCTGEKEAAVANLELAIPRGACWIFHHMRRSGGEPIKAILNSFIARHSIKRGLYGNSSWRKGTDFARDFCNHDYVVSWGAYTESLRPRKGTNSCKWFTVFRHPVSRVVSAYFHCRKEGTPWKEHSLCSASATDREFRVDLLNFARHWGNFGLRQFALAFVLPEEVRFSHTVDNLGIGMIAEKIMGVATAVFCGSLFCAVHWKNKKEPDSQMFPPLYCRHLPCVTKKRGCNEPP